MITSPAYAEKTSFEKQLISSAWIIASEMQFEYLTRWIDRVRHASPEKPRRRSTEADRRPSGGGDQDIYDILSKFKRLTFLQLIERLFPCFRWIRSYRWRDHFHLRATAAPSIPSVHGFGSIRSWIPTTGFGEYDSIFEQGEAEGSIQGLENQSFWNQVKEFAF
ncbi:hypothetical protein LINGRAHAP2_LOCUS36580 [Linum grandiflorum]